MTVEPGYKELITEAESTRPNWEASAKAPFPTVSNNPLNKIGIQLE